MKTFQEFLNESSNISKEKKEVAKIARQIADVIEVSSEISKTQTLEILRKLNDIRDSISAF